MQRLFNTIGLTSHHRNPETKQTLTELIAYLKNQHKSIVLEKNTASFLEEKMIPSEEASTLGMACDLVIVVGGDGSLLHTARMIVDTGTPIIGINRGRLGFLTDIKPDELTKVLTPILSGEYKAEERFLLEASMNGKIFYALNDVVMGSNQMGKMIDFEIYVDNTFVCREQSDGFIVATPTGSTAYAMSAGGPILHPSLNSIVLISMLSHTLSSRPLVISGDSTVKIKLAAHGSTMKPSIAADGQHGANLENNETLLIKKKIKPLLLLHPLHYDYYENLRSKLYWGK